MSIRTITAFAGTAIILGASAFAFHLLQAR